MFRIGDKVIVKPSAHHSSSNMRGEIVSIKGLNYMYPIEISFSNKTSEVFLYSELELDKNYLVKNIIKGIL
jgi:hypothetical protein